MPAIDTFDDLEDDQERAVAMSVYTTTWDEFLQWDRAYNIQTIAEVIAEVADKPFFPTPYPNQPLASSIPSKSEPKYATEQILPDGILEVVLPVPVIDRPALELEPSPDYESCPLSSSMNFMTAPMDGPKLIKFIPYADRGAKGFTSDQMVLKYLQGKEYYPKHTQWSVDFERLDLVLVQLEVLRRLCDMGFTLSYIDSMQIMEPLYQTKAGPGLLRKASQMSFSLPGFGPDVNQIRALIVNTALENMSLLESVQSEASRFCSNLNCISLVCPVHRSVHPPPRIDYTRKPKLRSDQLVPNPDCVAQEKCFSKIDGDELDTEMEMDLLEDSISVLEATLQFEPDMSPCDLAVMARISCRKVFIYRKQFHPDVKIEDLDLSENDPDEPELKDGIRAKKGGFSFATRVPPCTHKGPCSDPDARCECYRNEQYCQRACRCLANCFIRWQGCDCDPGVSCCRVSKWCACRKAQRECDPELCNACGARSVHGQYPFDLHRHLTQDESVAIRNFHKMHCGNVSIQKGIVPVLEIKRSAWGLGCFAKSTIHAGKGAFIGEYTAELHEFKNHYDDFAHKHKFHANYCFDLDDTYLADAARLGNETRFLNDDLHKDGLTSTHKINCKAALMLVNGDIKLGLFATKDIIKGEELYLSYGENYWNEHKDQGAEAEDEQSDRPVEDSDTDSTSTFNGSEVSD
ncbi:hypothetical protein C8J56DRAFT_920772 [Mycena floridula]|nr:hypothetical protein C8J56DRAFT_920772 [Mycena floridula]